MLRSRRFFNAPNKRELLLPYLLVAPALVVLLTLSIYPLLYSITISLQQQTSSGVVWSLIHFKRLASDGFFQTAMVHTVIYALAALTCEFLLGLGLALLLNQQIRGRGLFRASLLVPMMLPTVVVGVVWRLLLHPNFGAINGTLKQVGINVENLTWTASPRLAFLAVIAVDVWQWTPFVFLVLLAGLQAIPQEPYEAALIDGSTRWQTFRHVTLPLLKPAILIVLLLRTMDLLRVFDQIFILTEGGPGVATEMISLYIYRTAFRFFDFGYAAAMSFVLLVLTNVVSVVYLKLLQNER
jgi:multiple sugar transport system permease protein